MPMNHMHKKRLALIGRAAAGGFAVVVAAGLTTAGAREENFSLEPEALVPEFDQVQTGEDLLPSAMSSVVEQAGIQVETIRHIGVSEYGAHWTALGFADDVCVLSMVSDTSAWGVNCSPRDSFYQDGMSLYVTGETTRGATAHLIPATVDRTDVENSVIDVLSDDGGSVPDTGREIEILGDSRLVVVGPETPSQISVERPGQADLVLNNLAIDR